MPIKAAWNKGNYKLPLKGTIYFAENQLAPLAKQFQQTLAGTGFQYKTASAKSTGKCMIELSIAPATFTKNKKEAYALKVDSDGVKITANDPHGIFNALQTLRQLINKNQIPFCNILDEPAYEWRGYMIDVGRNYQPLALIKQQIDVMALAKLNVFHFHATDHVAWRFASKKYRPLNAPESMTRYSDAFTRAMGFGMQTKQGLAVVKEFVKEFADTYDIKYLHLGADEVKITMPTFVPEMVKYVQGLNKQIVAWWPEKINDTDIIRNLWFGDVEEKAESEHVRIALLI